MLDDWRTAQVDDRLRATLGFLEKLTLSPEDVGSEDVAAVRQVPDCMDARIRVEDHIVR